MKCALSLVVLAFVFSACNADEALSAESALQAEHLTIPFIPSDPSIIKAEIVSERIIRVIDPAVRDESALPSYAVTHHDGTPLPVASARLKVSGLIELTLDRAIDRRVVHHVSWPDGRRVRARFDGWFRDLSSDKPLGLTVAEDGSHTTIGVFAPRADTMTLYLYDRPEATPEEAVEIVELAANPDGVFTGRLEGNRHGQWYTLTTTGPDGPGSRFYGTHNVHTSEAYAKVYDERHAKARIWKDGPAPIPVKGGRPAMEDVVAYEVHVQDFTDLLPVKSEMGASLEAFVAPGLLNRAGFPIGIDHLVDLGINVVHLLPVQEFLHDSDAAWTALYGDDPLMAELGIATENYQWGYRTTHFFAVEGRFRTPGTQAGMEREQFRSLINAFHERGIAVIIDMVPNHTGENMHPGREELTNFNAHCRFYCYRVGDDGEHIGAFGNEVKTEERPMMRRWLIDQARHFMEDFGVDGFRIDLAGQIDEQTLHAMKAALPADAIIYGEPWIDSNDPYVKANPDWDWYKEDAPITFFQDDTRDALVGSPFVLEDPATDLGFAGGNAALRDLAVKAIANGWETESGSPNEGLNYADIHDNWTLADRFALADWDGRKGVNEAGYRIAAGLLLTSMGPVVIHGGSEFMRSKGMAPLHETHHETVGGAVYHLKGREDTYNVRTPNQFDWEKLGTISEAGDHGAMNAWWRGLIRFRLSGYGSPIRSDKVPGADDLAFLTPDNPSLLGYRYGETVLVLVNVGTQDAVMEGITLPQGNWRQIADGARIDHEASFATLSGGTHDMVLAAQSLTIWVRD
jgi:pullulanase